MVFKSNAYKIEVVSVIPKADREVSYTWTVPPISKSSLSNSKNGVYAKSSVLAMLPVFGVLTVGASQGVFWSAFLTYIFPYMLDIAKVFCAIKIAQAFYQEKRGGRDEGGGIGAFVTYGKWYLLFSIMPWAVELIDQLGGKMLSELP